MLLFLQNLFKFEFKTVRLYQLFMNPKKDSKKQKEKTEEKFHSPLPKKNITGLDISDLNLSDLSPFRPLYGSCQAPHYIHFSNAGMEFIETPAHTAPRPTFIEQIDSSLKKISGIIDFDNGNEHPSSSEQDVEYVTDSESEGLEVLQEDLDEEEKANPSENPDRQSRPFEPIIILSQPKEKKENKKPNLTPPKPSTEKRVFCNCKKTKCLKLYCDCFRDNKVCGEGCNCQGCHNLQVYEDERNNAMLSLMDRNPEAFKPKIEEQHHSKGCHCKKSNCQKKYCECFQAGLKCGQNCKCQECKNVEDHNPEDHHTHEKEDIRRTTVKKERRHEWYPAV